MATGVMSAALVTAVSIALSLAHCGAALDGEGAYAAQSSACAGLARSRASAEACVAETERIYCGPLGLLLEEDGGGFCAGVDAGPHPVTISSPSEPVADAGRE